jgi:hypothetical protein
MQFGAVGQPSMVTISEPEAWAASIEQDFTALPSRWITQAPHCEVSQPTWVPVIPRFSRRKCTSNVRSSTSPLTLRPFTTISTLDMVPPPNAVFSCRKRLRPRQTGRTPASRRSD